MADSVDMRMIVMVESQDLAEDNVTFFDCGAHSNCTRYSLLFVFLCVS